MNGDNGDAVLGNSETKTAKRPEGIRWVLTWNNYKEEDLKEFGDKLNDISKGYILGREIGENGTPHIQGYIELKKKMRSTAILKIQKHLHLDIAKGTKEDNIKYTTKDNNFISGGCFAYLEPLEIITKLFPWQIELENIAKQKPHNRDIYWIYNEKGNVGKTDFAKYLCYHYKAIPLEGKKGDMLYVASKFPSKIYIFDVERSLEDFLSYGGIEKVKCGLYMNAKYEGEPIIRNRPHIFIFANFLPDIKKVSLDFWKIYELENKHDNLKPIDIQDPRLIKY